MADRPVAGRSIAPWSMSLQGDDWPLLVGLPAVVVVFVFIGPRLGWWAFGAALLVYAAGYLAFDRHREVRRIAEQLVETLGRLPEAAGAVPPGHVERSAILATAVARMLGLDQEHIDIVAAAARTRTVGRVGRDRWSDGRDRFDEDAVARWSADILRRNPVLEAVARLVEPATDTADRDLLLMRSIVQVTTAYDEATTTLGMAADDAIALIGGSVPEDGRPVVRALASIFGVTTRGA